MEKVIKVGAGLKALVIWEPDPRLRQESGWYIGRIRTSDLHWADYASPGWGATYWVLPEKAKEYGLEVLG